MKAKILMAIVFSSIQVHASDSICDAPATLTQLNIIASSPKNEFTDSSFRDAIQDKRLVLIGDEHFNTSTVWMQDLVRKFRHLRGPYSCVAFEFPDVTPSADQYLVKHVKDYQDVINQLTKMRNSKTSEQDNVRIEAALKEAADDSAQFYNYFKPLTSLAMSLGMKNFAVDDPAKEKEDISMADRNAAMAQNLADLLKSETCSDVIMFVGKAHLAPPGQITTVIGQNSLKFFLATFFKQYSAVTINIQMTRETVPEKGRTWNKCPAPTVAKPVIFPSAYLIFDDSTIMPEVKGSPLLREFDYTILLP